jgi:hypothetical protein
MNFALLICFLSFVSTGVGAFEITASDANKNQKLSDENKNPFLEKYLSFKYGEQAKAKRVSKVGKLPGDSEDIDGFVVSGYYEDSECDATVAGVTSGTAAGVCYTVTDIADNSTYGTIFRYESETNGLIYMTALVYSDADCANYVSGSPFPILAGCQQFTEGSWVKIEYTTNKEPWQDLPPGVFRLYYDTLDHCKEGGVYGQFAHYTLNYCGEGGNMLTACADNVYTYSTYTDNTCKQLVSSFTSPLQRCLAIAANDDDDSTTTSELYGTGQCKSTW